MRFRTLGIVFACSSALIVQAQSASSAFTKEATVNRASSGELTVTASSPRPLWQAIESLRLKYGWVVDYEDPIYPPDLIKVDSAGRNSLVGGSFTSHIQEPANDSRSEEKRVLAQLIDQYNSTSLIKYRLIEVSAERFDVTPSSNSPMDQVVSVDETQRSLREEVDMLMNAYTVATGNRAVQGGFIDSVMENMHASLKYSEPVPLRQLLSEVLKSSPVQKVWLVTYEPNGKYIAIGVRNAEQWVNNGNGTTVVKTFRNSQFVPGKSE